MKKVIDQLSVVLADTAALSLKTQNYHWHVRGPQFYALHQLFQAQYEELSGAIDTIAEWIVSLGHPAPATFSEFMKLKTMSEGQSSLNVHDMLLDLKKSHEAALASIQMVVKLAEAEDDQATLDMMVARLEAHRKHVWMIAASV